MLVLLAACNGLLELTAPLEDSDRDGVADLEDNCPIDPNPQQADADLDGVGNVCDCEPAGLDLDVDGVDDACDDCVGLAEGVDSGHDGIDDGCQPCRSATGDDVDADGIDDGCDVCLGGPDHDEDGDGVFDGCDNCPSVSNPDQLASTEPAIGDACYLVGTRSVFDSFAVQNLSIFPGDVSGWTWEGDALVASSLTGSIRTLNLDLGRELLLETRVSTSGTVELTAVQASQLLICQYDPVFEILASGLSSKQGLQQIPAVTADASVRLQLQIEPSRAVCRMIDSTQVVEVTVLESLAPRRFQLRSSTGVSRFEYVWVTTD